MVAGDAADEAGVDVDAGAADAHRGVLAAVGVHAEALPEKWRLVVGHQAAETRDGLPWGFVVRRTRFGGSRVLLGWALVRYGASPSWPGVRLRDGDW